MAFLKVLDSAALEALWEIRHTIICQWTLQHDSSHGYRAQEIAHFSKHCNLCLKTCKGDPSTIRLLYASLAYYWTFHICPFSGLRKAHHAMKIGAYHKDQCCWEYRTRKDRSFNPSLAVWGNHKAGSLVSRIYQQYLPLTLPKPWSPPRSYGKLRNFPQHTYNLPQEERGSAEVLTSILGLCRSRELTTHKSLYQTRNCSLCHFEGNAKKFHQ